MKRILAIFLALLFLLTKPVLAQDEFISKVEAVYQIEENGTAKVTHNISLENSFSNLYATSYTINVVGLKPENVTATEGGQDLPIYVETKDDTTSIKVEFLTDVVGKGKKRKFSISFAEKSLAVKTGEVWEVTVPKLTNKESFDDYSLVLLVPTSLGQEAFVSPDPVSKDTLGSFRRFVFDKESVARHGVTTAFGQFQVFSFDLTYHLENPLPKASSVAIAIPPDTAFQKVNYQTMDPTPKIVSVDQEGNWIASFDLKPRERLDVRTVGSVQIFASPREFTKPSDDLLLKNIAPSAVWQSDNSYLAQLGKDLGSSKAIYDYVVNTLSYDYNRVRPNVDRLGAVAALQSPNTAICMEFTDTFIALARAAGIPAREINGYAYTENPELQPLSLVADVLHAWPEYWDENKQVWIPVDPTWGSTTGGQDFYSKLDLRHFAFVMHGLDPYKPYPPGSYKLGANPQKDVYISFSQLAQERKSIPTVEIKQERSWPFIDTKVKAVVKNEGPVALYNLSALALFDKKIVQEKDIAVLPPWGQEEMEITIPFSLLGTKTPEEVEVLVGGVTTDVPTGKTQVIIVSLTLLFMAIIGIVAAVYVKTSKFRQKSGTETSS